MALFDSSLAGGRAALQPTLAAALWRGGAALPRAVLLAVAGSLLLWLSARVQVPFWPVPMTMQTFMVLLIGAAYGPRLGMATVALYLAEGAVGLPVFAGTPEKGIGIAYMMGPTGGYLAGFVLAAGVVGWLARRGWDRRVLTTALAMAIGHAVIYMAGAAWLSAMIGLEMAVVAGVAPFLAGDAVKVALAACVLPLAWRGARRAAGRNRP